MTSSKKHSIASKKRWAGIPKEERSKRMSKVAKARYKKNKKIIKKTHELESTAGKRTKKS